MRIKLATHLLLAAGAIMSLVACSARFMGSHPGVGGKECNPTMPLLLAVQR